MKSNREDFPPWEQRCHQWSLGNVHWTDRSFCPAHILGCDGQLARWDEQRSPGHRRGNPLQYSCLENPMDRGAWWATVHWVARVGYVWVTKLPTPVSWPGELHGLHNPRGCKELDKTESPALSFRNLRSAVLPERWQEKTLTVPPLFLSMTLKTKWTTEQAGRREFSP